MAFPNIEQHPQISVDCESTGLEWYKEDRAFGVSIYLPTGDAEYYDIRKDRNAFHWMKDNLWKAKKIVNHNIKFDIHMMRATGINLNPANCECTMIRAALIDEHLLKYDLDSLLKKYLKMSKDNDIYADLAQIFGGQPTRKVQILNLHRAPVDLVARYANIDTEGAYKLWEWQEAEIERQDLHQVWALERRLFRHIVEMERRGIRIDPNEANRRAEELDRVTAETVAELNRLAGFEVNPNPSGSIKKLFNPQQNEAGVWVARDGTPLPKTDSGAPSLGAKSLESMTDPCAKLILKARKLNKTKDTFIRGHVLGHAIQNGQDWFVHPNINQTKSDTGDGSEGTGTGRLSYTRPALQQIPSRDKEIASIVRPIFLPDRGQRWSYGDLDQHEFRIFAHYANPKDIIEAYAQNPDLDMHQIVADLTGMPRSATKAGEANAKQINLGMVFNMGAGELASQMGLPFTIESVDFGDHIHDLKKAGPETLEIVENYYSKVQGVKEMARKARTIAKSRGYVRTLMGRHIRFPRGMFTYKASGLIFQGTAGDLNKVNICNISEYLESECPYNRLLLNIHDEYSVSLEDDGKEVKHLKELKGLVEDRPELRVPIRIDFSHPAPNWWLATRADLATK
jgi:DNA polymerase I-like protein with 3'-5' exonuclease and polymerase domains